MSYEYTDWSEVKHLENAVMVYGHLGPDFEREGMCQHATLKSGRCWGGFRINDPVDRSISGKFWWRCGGWATEGTSYCGLHNKIRSGWKPSSHGSRDRRRQSKVGEPNSPARFYRYERFSS